MCNYYGSESVINGKQMKLMSEIYSETDKYGFMKVDFSMYFVSAFK